MNLSARLLVITNLGYARSYSVWPALPQAIEFGMPAGEAGHIVVASAVEPVDNVRIALQDGCTVEVEVPGDRKVRRLVEATATNPVVSATRVADPDGVYAVGKRLTAVLA